MSSPPPGGENQTAVRSTLRRLGLLLGIAGALLVLLGFGTFAVRMDSFSGPPTWSLLAFGGGGLLAVIGFAMASMGYQGAVARFSAGEQAPVLKDTAHYLSDGQGIAGVGRTRSDAIGGETIATGATGTGPFCRQCGTRNDDTARFCDSCGTAMA